MSTAERPRGRWLLTRTAAAVLLVVALGSCGDEQAGAGGGEPATPQSFAAVVAEHLGEPDSAGRPGELDEFGKGAVGAELRYGSDGEYDGDLVAVLAGTKDQPALHGCGHPEQEYLAGCAETDEGTLMWEAEAPEEDPGVVYVSVRKEGTSVLVFSAGPAITDDPRELDLAVSVDEMFEVATDPRIGVTTSAAAVEAGERLTYWSGS